MTEVVTDTSPQRCECYEFTWPGKAAARAQAYAPCRQRLEACPEESVEWATTHNVYVEGDNLEALKLLRENYGGKIELIYIDPPYNTGHDFLYPDSFRVAAKNYPERGAGPADNGADGRCHSQWCSLLYSRLLVARELLSDDGVLFVSIDDGEVHNLRHICDEVLGSENFVTTFVWEKTQHFGRQKRNSYANCEYVVAYAKRLNGGRVRQLLVERVVSDLLDAPLYNGSNNIQTLTFPAGTVRFRLPDGLYQRTESARYELLDAVRVLQGINANALRLRFRSRWSAQTVARELQAGTTFLVKTPSFAIRAVYGSQKVSTAAPRQIIFSNSHNPRVTLSRFGRRVDTSENASAELEQLMGAKTFTYPKPVSLLAYLISLLYDEERREHKREFTVLDFFSGSAATAQAVLELNALDGGQRHFVMVQLPVACPAQSAAGRAGYSNICAIGKERIRRVAARLGGPTSHEVGGDPLTRDNAQTTCQERAEHASGDTGFRVYRIVGDERENTQATELGEGKA